MPFKIYAMPKQYYLYAVINVYGCHSHGSEMWWIVFFPLSFPLFNLGIPKSEGNKRMKHYYYIINNINQILTHLLNIAYISASPSRFL
jgi:hypothetical protein